MIASTEHKSYQKLLKKGKGSILKSIRTDKGAGRGLIAGGLCLLAFAFLSALLSVLDGDFLSAVISLLPGLLLLVPGIYLKNKRDSSWLSYYQKKTGFTEMELHQLERELTSSDVNIVICRQPGAATDSFIACFITENYMVMNGMDPYVRRLEDIIAVAFSDSTDIWSMSSLTRQDKETMAVGLITCGKILFVIEKHDKIGDPELISTAPDFLIHRKFYAYYLLIKNGCVLTLLLFRFFGQKLRVSVHVYDKDVADAFAVFGSDFLHDRL